MAVINAVSQFLFRAADYSSEPATDALAGFELSTDDRIGMVVVANLREQALDEVLAKPVAGLEDALRFQAVA